METYIAEFSNNINKLTALRQELFDNLISALLFGSLPESYDTFDTVLKNWPASNITSQYIRGKLIDEFKKQKRAKDVRDNFGSGEIVIKTMYNSNRICAHIRKICFFWHRYIKQDGLK